MIYSIYFKTVIVTLILIANGQSEPLIETSLGRIKGSVMSSASGRPFSAFRGIPYAQPPTGSLRFKDPVPVEPWGAVLDATLEGPKCLQFDFYVNRMEGVEDCLLLNVYTQNTSENVPRPVMVWIHGGGFSMGSGNGETDFYGPHYFMDKDVVLVTINYRVGVFGFFSTGSGEAPGNYGMLDQIMALKWVKKHIHHFGGDAESVTIFGESAGGASVHLLVLSPLCEGLFQRAIIQSGTSLNPWTLPHVTKHSLSLVEQLGCRSADDPIECLRRKEAEDLVIPLEKNVMPPIFYGPRIDAERQNPFLPADPLELLRTGQYNHVPLIIGVNKNEGINFIGADGLLSSPERLRQFQENPLISMRNLLTIPDHVDVDAISQRALEHYLDQDRPLLEQLQSLEKMISDFAIFKGTDDAVRWHSSHDTESVFYYLNAYRPQNSLTLLFGVTGDYGVCHGDELLMMFTNPCLPPLSSAEDRKMSRMFVEWWTSFAASGEPTSEFFSEWKPSTKQGTRYLHISTDPQLVSEEMPFHHRLAFWDQIAPSTVRDEL